MMYLAFPDVNRWGRRALERTLRKTKDAGLAKRCRIGLLHSRGWTYQLIARTVGVSAGPVQRVLRCYKAYGPAGLIDRREDKGQGKGDEKFLKGLEEGLEPPVS